jgi:hypothetical protein
MGYVEMEDGEVVDGHAAADIRKYARSIWVHIATTSETGTPAKWGEAGVKNHEAYRTQMYERYPNLQFCESDWKVDQIATDYYPSWYSTWRKNHSESGPTIKAEHCQDSESNSRDLRTSKRPHEAVSVDSETDPRKRKPIPSNDSAIL